MMVDGGETLQAQTMPKGIAAMSNLQASTAVPSRP